jgi:LL-diaminopimelate aminotransferase
VASDLAYSEMYLRRTSRRRRSSRSPGARDVAIEFHSLSKTYNMTGWRVGFAAATASSWARSAR